MICRLRGIWEIVCILRYTFQTVNDKSVLMLSGVVILVLLIHVMSHPIIDVFVCYCWWEVFLCKKKLSDCQCILDHGLLNLWINVVLSVKSWLFVMEWTDGWANACEWHGPVSKVFCHTAVICIMSYHFKNKYDVDGFEKNWKMFLI